MSRTVWRRASVTSGSVALSANSRQRAARARNLSILSRRIILALARHLRTSAETHLSQARACLNRAQLSQACMRR
jgi:hypothetical protein